MQVAEQSVGLWQVSPPAGTEACGHSRLCAVNVRKQAGSSTAAASAQGNKLWQGPNSELLAVEGPGLAAVAWEVGTDLGCSTVQQLQQGGNQWLPGEAELGKLHNRASRS